MIWIDIILYKREGELGALAENQILDALTCRNYLSFCFFCCVGPFCLCF